MVKKTNKYTMAETLDDIESWINDSMYYTGYSEESGVVKVNDLILYLKELRERSGIKVGGDE
jgi:hypothetical protein